MTCCVASAFLFQCEGGETIRRTERDSKQEYRRIFLPTPVSTSLTRWNVNGTCKHRSEDENFVVASIKICSKSPTQPNGELNKSSSFNRKQWDTRISVRGTLRVFKREATSEIPLEGKKAAISTYLESRQPKNKKITEKFLRGRASRKLQLKTRGSWGLFWRREKKICLSTTIQAKWDDLSDLERWSVVLFIVMTPSDKNKKPVAARIEPNIISHRLTSASSDFRVKFLMTNTLSIFEYS